MRELGLVRWLMWRQTLLVSAKSLLGILQPNRENPPASRFDQISQFGLKDLGPESIFVEGDAMTRQPGLSSVPSLRQHTKFLAIWG